MSSFSIMEGSRAISSENKWFSILLVIFLGVLGHWFYDTLLAAASSGKFDPGTPLIWAVRGGIALFASALGFVGIYEQVRKMTNPVRLFTAFNMGFAIDALSGSAISALAGSGPAPEPASVLRVFLLA